MWAVLCGLENIRRGSQQPIRHPERVSHYEPFRRQLRFKGIKFPVAVKDIDIFERNNPSISINVYSFDNNSSMVHLLRGTKNVKEHHLHLMLLTNETNTETPNTPNTHYYWI